MKRVQLWVLGGGMRVCVYVFFGNNKTTLYAIISCIWHQHHRSAS
jgi:hypothetical protein